MAEYKDFSETEFTVNDLVIDIYTDSEGVKRIEKVRMDVQDFHSDEITCSLKETVRKEGKAKIDDVEIPVGEPEEVGLKLEELPEQFIEIRKQINDSDSVVVEATVTRVTNDNEETYFFINQQKLDSLNIKEDTIL